MNQKWDKEPLINGLIVKTLSKAAWRGFSYSGSSYETLKSVAIVKEEEKY